MNLPDDMLPEEREPQYEELITLLQQAYSKPVSVSLERQQQILSRVRARLLKADLETSSTEDTPLPVLGTMNSSSNKPKTLIGKHLLSTLVAVLLMVVLLGTTLLFLGSWLSTTDGHSSGELSLQVTPSTVSVNGTITLHGSHFSPNAHVGLMRDMDIAIVDTHDQNIISADSSGSFTDTVFVDANYWEPGAHIIHAEDAISHQTASFPIMVIGHGASLPPHLVLSQTSLDLGSGDLATNSTASMTVADSGGGVINWQSATTQPWLVLSPTHGTLADGRGMQVMVAVDRSKLSPGNYSGEIIITSNAGKQTVSVKMQVTPLHAQNEGVLQVDPAALSFAATRGGANPPTQTVTISDPGLQSFQWGTSTSTTDGANWLTVSPSVGNVAPQGGSQTVQIGVNPSTLLPGVYSGWVNFSNASNQPVQDSPQRVFVSLTISQSPTLKAGPTSLTFNVTTGTSSQPITISNSGGQPLNWNAALAPGAPSFVSLSATSGTNLAGGTSTITNIVMNAAGIPGPQTFTTSVQISALDPSTNLPTAGSPATVSITITIAPPAMQVDNTNLSFTAIQGSNPPSQAITITDTGGDGLGWTVGTPSASWLTASPRGGSDNNGASSPITFSVNTNGLNPGSYSATVTITPSTGSTVTINVALIVNGVTPTPLPTPNVTSGAGSVSLSASQAQMWELRSRDWVPANFTD